MLPHAIRTSNAPRTRRLLLGHALLGACLLTGLGSAQAQVTYPQKPILMVVPQAAGGTNDIVGRLVSQKLSEVLGSPVAVENRPGAGGNIGTQFAAKAPKDGYTLLMTISSSQAINPALYKNPGFDPVKDFKPVALIGAVPNVLLAHPSFSGKTVQDLIAIAETTASCQLWGLLKRPDEKYVTERAYENPKFVEDLVRDIAVALSADLRVARYEISSENFESIHNHSAFAWLTGPQ